MANFNQTLIKTFQHCANFIFSDHVLWILKKNIFFSFGYTVKPVCNGHPWDPKKAAVVQRLRHKWSLFTVSYYKILENWGSSWPL
jgi:hypothetical protein